MTTPANVAPVEEKDWRRLLAPYKQASWGRALFQLANTLIPFVLLWAAMAMGVSRGQPLVLLLVIPTSFFFIRLFILQHDCGHGAFFPSRAANNLLGSMLGVITLFPYGYWRRTHSIHHATTGNLDQREFGDVRTLTVREYQALSPLGRFGYRLYRHPFVLFGVGPTYQFLLKHRLPIDIPWSWKREWKSVLTTNLAIGAAVYALSSIFSLGTVALVYLPVIVVAGAIGVWLFYVQHQFEEAYWQSGDSWDFYRAAAEGSSFYDLHPVLHWLTGNIGYHHIHHLSSQIPNYRLAECFHENPALQKNVTHLTLRQSLRCAALRLWDEEKRTMVRFRDLVEAQVQTTVPDSKAPAVG